MISTSPVSQRHINELLIGLRSMDKFSSLEGFAEDETIEWVIKKSFLRRQFFSEESWE
jgi:hypothetical protein